MDPDDDRAIFEAGSQPEPEATDPQGLPPDRSAEDQAVSQAIQGLQHSRDDHRPTPPPPAAPRGSQPDLEGIDDRSSAGLLKALLDERERRQAAEQHARRYETFVEEQRRRATPDNRPPLSQRLFEDPEGTLNELREQWIAPLRQEMQQDKINNDFARTHERHGDTFREAWENWYGQVAGGNDAQSYFAVMNSPSPGEAMVSWHKRRLRDETVGDDIDAFRQRVIEEYEAGRGGAPPLPRDGNGRFQPRPQAQQRLPTAVSRMGSQGKGISPNAEALDGSDAAIFAAASRPRRGER